MTRNMPADDRRYMSHEVRAIDDPRYRGTVERKDEGTKTCYCGKTVVSYNGRATGASCPRECGEPDDPRFDDPAYLAYCDEREREYQQEQAHGGRTRCKECGEFEVEHRIVEAHRDPTDVGTCRACGHVEI